MLSTFFCRYIFMWMVAVNDRRCNYNDHTLYTILQLERLTMLKKWFRVSSNFKWNTYEEFIIMDKWMMTYWRQILCEVNNLFVTYFHEFWIYESTNFFHESCSWFLLKELQSVSFFVKINSFSNIFDLNRKFYLVLKEKQEKFREKNVWIRRFRIRENMSRTC